MTALLTDNLPLLAGAPNGIKKLRELILELAVRGKLLPQEPSDEPASELLKRIAEEKARLVAEGKIKKQKPLAERDAEDPAFELPAGWAWARLADVVNVLNGRAYKKEELLDVGTPVLRVGNLFTSNHWYYSTLTLEEDKYCNPGDLLFAWSASFGPFIWHGERSIYHYHIWKLDFYAKGQLSKHYLYNYLLEQTQEIKAAGHGVSMVHMTKEKMEKLVVPVPPLAEQHRIVAKVDELMALCDRLEAQQVDAESAHAQLVQALLDSLTQASDATEFAANWQRLAAHFHTLFTTEPSIDALKQTLLHLAVMGKLVPQDPRDEPVESLLQRRGIKSKPHALQGWGATPLGQLGEILGGSTPSKANAEFWNGDIPWVSPKDMKRPVIHDSEDHISAKALAETSLKAVPAKSLLMVVRGMILVHSFPVALTAREVTINQDMKALVPPEEISAYLHMYLQATKAVMVGLVDRSSHGTCKLISEKLWSHIVCLPPLPEQHRIVAKVDQLLGLCDQLKTRLTQARQLNEQLASTLVEQAVA